MPIKVGNKGIVLFIHGFGSSEKCWAKMLKLLREDEQITSQYDLLTWEYPTKWIELNLLGRIPRLEELGRSLREEIDSPQYRGKTLTLVGHSQGGLVIQSYFVDLLHKGKASKLSDVRQVILMATPNEGSLTGMNLRRVFSFLQNPQERTLRVLNCDVSDLRADIRERIVAAKHDTDNSWRVPMHAFIGMQDNIVPEASARGPFDSVKPVPGNHFSIIKPKNREVQGYREFIELLLDPRGHSQRFEIENYETDINIEPREKSEIMTESKKNPRLVKFDNFGTIKRTVKFSPNNRCVNPLTIRYGTRKEGYVVGYTSHKNEATPATQGLWEDTGTSFQFDFTPKSSEDFCLKVDIYKGFDEGERDVHFHLGDHSYYRKMEYNLDLSAYVNKGFKVSQGPDFYFHPEDHPHGEICKKRGARDPIEMLPQKGKGVYQWELNEIKKGIVDIVWDVA